MKTDKINCESEYDEELEMEIFYIIDEQNNRFVCWARRGPKIGQ